MNSSNAIVNPKPTSAANREEPTMETQIDRRVRTRSRPPLGTGIRNREAPQRNSSAQKKIAEKMGPGEPSTKASPKGPSKIVPASKAYTPMTSLAQSGRFEGGSGSFMGNIIPEFAAARFQ